MSGFFVAYAAGEVTITPENPSAVGQTLEPALNDGDNVARGNTEYIGRRTVNVLGSELGTLGDTIKWKVTITGPSTLSADDIDFDEVGWADLSGNSAAAFYYPLSGTGGVLEAVGSCDLELPSGHEGGAPCTTDVGFSVDANDNFVNADSIKFNYSAPNGTYTIKYELVNGDVVLGTYQVSAVNVTDPALIASADPADVDEGFDPEIDLTITRGSDAYLGRTTTYNGPQIGLGDPETIKWKVTVSHETDALTEGMVDLDEVGWKDQTDSSTLAFHYPLTANGNNLVATGSCDAVLPSGHDGGDPCTTVDGFSLVAGDVFTNADKIKFNSSALGGEYTITYELVNIADGLVVGTHVVTVGVVNTEIAITADAQSKTYGDADPVALTYQITGSLEEGDTELEGTLSRDAGENVGTYGITIGSLASANPNYDIINFTGNNLTITARPITVTGTTATKVYDGTLVSSVTPSITVGTLATGDTGNFTQAYVTMNVGAAKILRPSGSVSDGNSGLNYAVTLTDGTGSVTKAVLTVTADDQSITYGEAGPVFTFQYSGFVNSENSSVIDTPPTASVPIAHINVGTYNIVPAGGSDNNYSFSYVNDTLTVTALPITVTANNQAKAFGSLDPALTYNDPLIGGDAFSGALTRDAGESVGTYAITRGTLDAGTNYDMTFVPGILTISDEGDPVITLNGDANMGVFDSNGFSDPGSVVTDNVDTGLVATVTGSVNSSTPGTYTLTYNVSDAAGNAAVPVTRTVTVRAASSGGGGGGGGGSSRSGGSSVSAPGRVLGASTVTGQVLGAFTEVERQALIATIKVQLSSLIRQLIGLLQAQLAAAITAGNQ